MRLDSLWKGSASWLSVALLVPLAVLAALGGVIGIVALVLMVAGCALIVAAASRANVRARHQTEESRRLALHDPVTDLPNRIHFHDYVRRAIDAADARGEGERVGVLLIDLDHFKDINDTLGHHCGDLLLYRVGERLLDVLRGHDAVARLGGDEFAVLLSSIDGERAAMQAAERIRTTLAERFEVQEAHLQVEASIGVALYPDHGTDPDVLLQRADISMYWAKHRHSGVETYSEERDEHSRARLELIAELHTAIEREQLEVYFQPKAELGSGRVVGVEALVRWNHPTRGFLPPDQFIPAAETTGLIGPLTRLVLRQSLRQSRIWADEGIDLKVAVNLSTRNLLDVTLPETVASLLAEYHVPARRLELEVTETTMMVDPERSAEVLRALAETGVSIAIDDFGTGYTSLSWLKRLPVATLKIDRSFISDMGSGKAEDCVIVRSTINLARELGLQVVAEGVEDQGTWEQLDDLDCDLAQGYLLSRPLPARELTPWLVTHLPDALSVEGTESSQANGSSFPVG
jgi:diguanylate cyclase (GGDEF)-like protein